MDHMEIDELLAKFAAELEKLPMLAKKKASEKEEKAKLEKYKGIQQSKGKELLRGIPGAEGLAVGTVRVVDDDAEKKAQTKQGEVYVASYPTTEDYPHLKKAAAIVTNRTTRTDYAAIFGKSWGIPTVVATHSATEVLKNSQKVVVDGSEGVVYAFRKKAPAKCAEH